MFYFVKKYTGMKTPLLLLLVFAFLIGLYSCECGLKCGLANYSFSAEFKGFNDSDLTPLVMKRYIKNTNFDSLYSIDTVNQLQVTQYENSEKTSSLYISDNTCDYIFFAPRINATYTLTQLDFTTGSCTSCSKRYKIQKLSTYVLNGTPKAG
jgi:hypothetical protein